MDLTRVKVEPVEVAGDFGRRPSGDGYDLAEVPPDENRKVNEDQTAAQAPASSQMPDLVKVLGMPPTKHTWSFPRPHWKEQGLLPKVPHPSIDAKTLKYAAKGPRIAPAGGYVPNTSWPPKVPLPARCGRISSHAGKANIKRMRKKPGQKRGKNKRLPIPGAGKGAKEPPANDLKTSKYPSCPHCGLKFCNEQVLEKHVRTHKDPLWECFESSKSGDMGGGPCSLCGIYIKTRDGYQGHMHRHNLTRWPCDDCALTFSTQDSLTTHRAKFCLANPSYVTAKQEPASEKE